jgi:hypothetical protein
MRPCVLATALAVAGLLTACASRPEVAPPDGGQDASHDTFVPAPPSDQLDLLFVIDNSNSDFGDGDPILSLSKLLAPLAAEHAGLSVHIGIVTSDLGAGAFTPPSCDTVGGDQGRLWNTTLGMSGACRTANFTDPAARFLAFSLAADGSTTDTDFVGSVDDTFRCYSVTGSGGCGYEHQLGSARAALDGCNTPAGCTQRDNAGFLRPEAYLAIIVMTTEDDCSAPADSTLFDPSQQTVSSELGPVSSYRCFEFGVLCDGQDVGRDVGVRTGCVPGNKDPDPLHQLVPVEELARDFKALKAVPRMVYTAVFAGPPTPVEVGLDASGFPDLQPSCGGRYSTMRGAADPAIRLDAFTRKFDADRARFFDACTSVADEAFAQIGHDLATALRGD